MKLTMQFAPWKYKASAAVLGSGFVPANLSADFRKHGMSCWQTPVWKEAPEKKIQ